MASDRSEPAGRSGQRVRCRRALFLFPTDKMGGAENVTRIAARAAAESGRFDEVICFVLFGAPLGTLDALQACGNVRLIYTHAGSEKFGLVHLVRVLARHRYDLVFSSHTHMNAAASLMRRLGLLRTRRLVSRESTMIFERDLGLRGKIARRLYGAYGGQDLVICQTERMAKSLSHHTEARFDPVTRVIPNPLDLSRLQAGDEDVGQYLGEAEPNARRIVWCGRIDPVKSPLRAVEAFAAMRETDAHLFMIGDGGLRGETLAHAERLGVAKRLTITGHLPRPAALMRHCDAGLLTSDTEGFPNVILEMLACGVKRVVTTDCAGGLRKLPGVMVVADSAPTFLGAALDHAVSVVSPDEDVPALIEAREPSLFLEKMLAA